VVVLNLWTRLRTAAPVPVEIRHADGTVPEGLVVDGGRRRLERGGILWLEPGTHQVGVADGAPTTVEVTSRSLPARVVVPATPAPPARMLEPVGPVEPVEPVERAAPDVVAAAAPGSTAAPGPWGAVAVGGLGVAAMGSLVVAGAELWLIDEADSGGRLSGAERILGQGVGVAGIIIAGVGIIGAVGGATLWWSGP
jgi:hypothetical protein